MKTEMELKILDWIQIIHVSWLDKLMVGITTLGNGGIIWIVSAAALLIIPKMRKAGTAMAVSLALEVLCCNVILKSLIARIRPCDVNAAVHLLIRRPADFSFPSGHTGAAFAAAAALYFGKNKLWIPACVLAVLMGFSRLYLYVHYPSDVLAAAMIGIMLGWFGNFLANGLWKKAIRHGKSLYN